MRGEEVSGEEEKKLSVKQGEDRNGMMSRREMVAVQYQALPHHGQ